jgi:hypothetical protein
MKWLNGKCNVTLISGKRYPKKWKMPMLLSVLLVFLLIAPTMAVDNQANYTTIVIHNSSVKSVPPAIEQEIDMHISEKMSTKDSLNNKIVEREQLLSSNFLKIDDTHSTYIQTKGFAVEKSGVPYETLKLNEYSQNEIPEGSFISFGPDAKTRVFSDDGTQLAFSDDTVAEKIKSSSGTIIPATHSIPVPSGSTVYDNGNMIHVTNNGKILLTMIDNSPAM